MQFVRCFFQTLHGGWFVQDLDNLVLLSDQMIIGRVLLQIYERSAEIGELRARWIMKKRETKEHCI